MLDILLHFTQSSPEFCDIAETENRKTLHDHTELALVLLTMENI